MTFTPTATEADREARKSQEEMEMALERGEHVPTKLDAHMRKNPLQWKWWRTKNGGYVMALGGWKVFYGRCADCGALVTTRRQHVVKGNTRFRGAGRWPSYCDDCRNRRGEEHDKRAPQRQRDRRQRERARRDESLRQRGLPLPRPGRPRKDDPWS